MEALRHRTGVLSSKCAVITIANCPGPQPHGLRKYAASAINMTWKGNLTTIKLEGLQDVFKTKIKGEISTRCSRFCRGRPAVALVHVLDTVLLYTRVNLLPCQRNHNLINTYKDFKGLA